MTKHSDDWFKLSPRNGGNATISSELREAILTMWAAGKTKREIANQLNIHVNTVKMTNWKARQAGDARAFGRSKPLLTTSASCTSVLELRNNQWFIRAMADRMEIHFTQAESMIRAAIEDVEKKLEEAK